MAEHVSVTSGAPSVSAGRLSWLDQLRAVAMFLVVVGHAVAPGSRLETLIYAFHMPLFFIISGMTFRPGRYTTVAACAVDKAKKLLVPYLLFSIAAIPWWYLNWQVLEHSQQRIPTMLAAIAISNQTIASSPENAMWYLPVLFLLSVLFDVLWRLGAGKTGRIAVLVAGCGLAGILLSLWFHDPVPWHLPTVLTASLFYYAGHLFMAHRERITSLVANRTGALVALVVALAAAGTFLALANGKVSMHNNQYNSVPMFLGSALLLSVAVILSVMRLPSFKWLVYLGQNTIVTLAVHVPMIRTIQHLSPAALRLTYAHPVIVGAAVFVATIPFAMLVNRYAPFMVAKRRPAHLQPATAGESG